LRPGQRIVVGSPQIKVQPVAANFEERRRVVTEAVQSGTPDILAHFVAAGAGRRGDRGPQRRGVETGARHRRQQARSDAGDRGAPRSVGHAPQCRTVGSVAGQEQDRAVGAAAHHTQPGTVGPEGIGLARAARSRDLAHLAPVDLPRPGDPVQPQRDGKARDRASVGGTRGIGAQVVGGRDGQAAYPDVR